MDAKYPTNIFVIIFVKKIEGYEIYTFSSSDLIKPGCNCPC